jgi:hypothetical protein
MQNLPAEEAVAVEDGGFNESQSQQTGGIGSSGLGLGGSEFSGRSTYSSQQQPVGTHKGIFPFNFCMFSSPNFGSFQSFGMCH